METQIQIKGITQKVTKTGKEFYIAQTDKGDMSVWDEDQVKMIQANIGKTLSVNVEEKDGFKNIRKPSARETAKPTTEATFIKYDQAMIEMAIDVWKVLRTEPQAENITDISLMDIAAQLVKEARKIIEEK